MKMKKVYLFIIMCLVGMIVPQVVFADYYYPSDDETPTTLTISVSGNTVTINSTNPGALWALLTYGEETEKQNVITAIQNATGTGSEIIFDGAFSGDDLKSLNTNNCCVQETVNMAATTFKKQVDLTAALDAYKINVKSSEITEGKTISEALNEKAQSAGVTPENGDIGVVDNLFYKYSDGQWSETDQPFFGSKERLDVCINVGQAWEKYAGAMVDGVPTLFQYKQDPSDYQSKWMKLDNDNAYDEMTFKYWGSNVKTAITSMNAAENDAISSEFCDGCSNLQVLTLGSGSFNGLGNNVTSLQTVNVKKDVTGLGTDMFIRKTTLTSLTFEEGGNKPLTIGEGCFKQCTGLTGTISLPKRISEIGADAFKETTGIEEVVFNEPSNLTTIHSGTFAESGIKRVTIPKSVTLIETNAFQGNADKNSGKYTRLEEVTFQGGNTTSLVIKTGAFQNCVEITDVYVNVKPSERLLICEYNAFDFKGMEGQTVQESEMTTLHFLEENFDYYAGEWKKGMAIKQSNLNAFKDGLEIRDDNGTLLYENPETQNPGAWGQYGFGAIEHYDNVDGYYHTNNSATEYAPANGWQQFAKTASPREVLIPGNVYMTYSTATPYSLPKGIIAFRVTDYKEAEYDNGKTKNGRLVLKMIDQVPTETGMLLISTDQYLMDSNGNRNAAAPSKFYFGDPVGTPKIYHYTMGQAGDDTSNYLAPAVHDIEVGPVSKGNPDPVTGAIDVKGTPFDHRNFAMNKNTHQFVRLKHIIMPDNRAFLSLPTTMFTNNNESATEGPNPWNTQAGDAFETYDTSSTNTNPDEGAKTTMFFEYDVEKYGMIWPLAQNQGETDGIDEVVSHSNAERVQQGIFTLQGVKVDSPTTKGIYIVNGKKVIIK